MTSLEYVKSQIAKLKDDLQHYTMVEKDSALASQIRYDLEQFETIEKELKAKTNLVSMCENLAKLVGLKEKDYVELETLITKKLKALNEIVALHDKWLGNEMSDFEFFTLLNDIKWKYGLENEVLK